ncbi:MAG: DUF3307 domain-containing protein, partial [Paracoccaceae bacterium]|nr:DUF3307 domain-containing protein [Paracoccaceae bacterium]
MTLALPPGAIATFAALLLAHMLADFLFQPSWMVARKRNPLILLLHGALVFVFSTAALGGVWQIALLVAALHLVIDAVKVWALPRAVSKGLAAFLTDQTLHLATLAFVAIWWPGTFAQGAWAAWAGGLVPGHQIATKARVARCRVWSVRKAASPLLTARGRA